MSLLTSKPWRDTLWAYAPLLFWICVIFYLSSDNGSMTQTSRFIGPLLRFLFPEINEGQLQTVHAVVRKFSHVAAYAILGLLALRAYRIGMIARWIALAGLTVLAVASLDEFNQSFTATRSGSIADVGLDLVGGALAMLLYLLIIKRRNQTLPDESVQE